jgi:hypothetical protein
MLPNGYKSDIEEYTFLHKGLEDEKVNHIFVEALIDVRESKKID